MTAQAANAVMGGTGGAGAPAAITGDVNDDKHTDGVHTADKFIRYRRMGAQEYDVM